MTIKIALTNLGKYNEGKLVYTWLELPASDEEIREAMQRIGIGNKRWDGGVYEEWFISDYEAPFSIYEYEDLTTLNETAEMLDGMDQDEMNAVIAIKENDRSLSWEEAAQMLHDGEAIMLYDCDDMEDVARYYVEEMQVFGDIDDLGILVYHIDYEALGRDLSFDGTFLFIDNSICVEIRG